MTFNLKLHFNALGTHKRSLKLFFRFLQGRNNLHKFTCPESYVFYFWGFWENSQLFAMKISLDIFRKIYSYKIYINCEKVVIRALGLIVM